MEVRKKLLQEFEKIASANTETVLDVLSKELQHFTADQLLCETPLVDGYGAPLPEWKRRVMASRIAERRNQERFQQRQRQLDAAEQKEWWKRELMEKRKRGQSMNNEPPVKTLSRPIRKDREQDSDTESFVITHNNSNNNSINTRNHSHGNTTKANWGNGRPVNSSTHGGFGHANTTSPINAVVKHSSTFNAVAKTNSQFNSKWPVKAVVKSSSPVNAVAKSSWAAKAVVKSSSPVNAVAKSSWPAKAVVKSSSPVNAVAKSSWPAKAVVKSSSPVNAVAKSSWPVKAVVKSTNSVNTPSNGWARPERQFNSAKPQNVSNISFNAVVRTSSPFNTGAKLNTSTLPNARGFNAVVKKPSLQQSPPAHPALGKSVSHNSHWSSSPPPIPGKNAITLTNVAMNRFSAQTTTSSGYEEHKKNPSELGYSSSEGYEEDEGLYSGDDYDSEDDDEDKPPLINTFLTLRTIGKSSISQHGAPAGSPLQRRRPGRRQRGGEGGSVVPPAPPMPSGRLTMGRSSTVTDPDSEVDGQVQLRPKKKKPPPDAEKHPHVSLTVLQSVQLKKTNNKFLGGEEESREEKEESDPEGQAASPPLTKQQAVVAELTATVEPDAPPSLMKEKVVLKQKKKEEELLQVDITPEGMLQTIPLVDQGGTPIPEWKRQMMARKAAQKAAAEQLEQKIKELELMKLPAWKRHQIETKKN